MLPRDLALSRANGALLSGDMTQQSIDRIRRSYRLIAPKMTCMAQIFYDRLFALHPEIRALFKVDMTMQGRHLAAALAMIVVNLPILDALEEPLRQLGQQHARVGVRPQHYPIVREEMLFALAAVAGDIWTGPLPADWGELIDHISRRMLAGADARSAVT